MHPYAPYDDIFSSHINYQLTCISSMGDRWGALLEALDDAIQCLHHTLNYASQTTLHYVDTGHLSEDKVPAVF